LRGLGLKEREVIPLAASSSDENDSDESNSALSSSTELAEAKNDICFLEDERSARKGLAPTSSRAVFGLKLLALTSSPNAELPLKQAPGSRCSVSLR